jgi:cation diffusion facilitator family transporter
MNQEPQQKIDIPIEQTFSGYSDSEIRYMRRSMSISLGVGISMLLMKSYAYAITGSAAILSDAAESIVHVLAVLFAAYSLKLSVKPADKSHMYGHDRIGFFSAGFEGAMIIIAAIYIIYEAVHKWLLGLQLEALGQGTLFTAAATMINAVLGWYLVRQGRKFHSLVLVANGRHVLTDSWTSLGVIIALLLILFTGWLPFDPVIAIAVAFNILWTGGKLMRQSIGGLMDEADPEADATLREVLIQEARRHNVQFHGLRHRNAGSRLLIEVHLLFPDTVSLTEAHEKATLIEKAVASRFNQPTQVITHLEPLEGHDEFHERLLKKT